MPKRPKEIEDVGKASMVDMRAALYQTESAARHPDGAASAALRAQRQRRARRSDPLTASSNRGVSERDESAARQEREDEARAAEAMARKVAMYEAMARGELPGETATDARGRSASSLAASAASLVDFELKQLNGDGDLLRLRAPPGGSGGWAGGEAGCGGSMSSSSMRREEERRVWEHDARREIAIAAAGGSGSVPDPSHAEMTNRTRETGIALTRETGIARASASDQRAKRQRALEDRRATLRLKQESRCRAAGDGHATGGCCGGASGAEGGVSGGEYARGAEEERLSGGGCCRPPGAQGGEALTAHEARESPEGLPRARGGLRIPPPVSPVSGAHGGAGMPPFPPAQPDDPLFPRSAFPPPQASQGTQRAIPVLPPVAGQPVAYAPSCACIDMPHAPTASCGTTSHDLPVPAAPQYAPRVHDWHRPPPPPAAAPPAPAPAPLSMSLAMGDEHMMRAMGLPSSFSSSAQAEAAAAVAAEKHQAAVQAAWAAYMGQGMGQGSMYSGQGARYGRGGGNYYQYPGQ